MSIKAKLSWLLISWSLLTLLIANTIIYFSYMKLTENREMDNLEEIGERLLETKDVNDLFSPSMRPLFQSFVPDDGMIRILDKDHSIVFRAADEDAIMELPISDSQMNRTEMVQLDDEMVAVFTAPIYKDKNFIGTIELSKNMDDRMEDLEILLTILIGVSVLLIVMAIFFGKKTSKIFSSPISVIGETMDNIQKDGRLEKIQLRQKNGDEIYQLAANFNRMIDYLEVMFRKQEQFISDASHELKTPLTVIESYASLLKRWGKDDPKLLNEGIDAIQDESKRLKHMVEQLLDLASADQQSFKLERMNITDICKQTAKRLEAAKKRIIHVIHDSEAIFGLANKEKLVQILIILLDNALKYSEKDIALEISQDEYGPVIQIIDQGIGIPKEEIPKLFERFYRVDKARTRTTGGSGLGLSIAYLLINQSGGSISIESENEKGTTVTVSFKGK